MRPPAEGASMPLLSTTHKNGPLYQAFSCPHLAQHSPPDMTGQPSLWAEGSKPVRAS